MTHSHQLGLGRCSLALQPRERAVLAVHRQNCWKMKRAGLVDVAAPPGDLLSHKRLHSGTAPWVCGGVRTASAHPGTLTTSALLIHPCGAWGVRPGCCCRQMPPHPLSLLEWKAFNPIKNSEKPAELTEKLPASLSAVSPSEQWCDALSGLLSVKAAPAGQFLCILMVFLEEICECS